jgi:hypothetical protein
MYQLPSTAAYTILYLLSNSNRIIREIYMVAI